MQVETVSGIKMDLPEDLAAGPSVIVIVYDQNQQPEADSWVAFLDNIAAINPAARYYLMPVLPAGLSVVRDMVEGVIRNSASNPLQLDRTIVLFTNVEALHGALGVSGTSAVHIVVLGDTGEVLAITSGAYSVAGAAVVADALAALSLSASDIGKLPVAGTP